MLEQARKRSDIEWILGDLTSVSWEREFDLIVMSGHAFQVFVEDDELRTALVAIRSALTEDGRFAFETLNPLVREWERWATEYTTQVTDSTGAVVRAECEVELPIEGDVVRFSYTFTNSSWRQPQVSRSTLRFLDVDSLCLGPAASHSTPGLTAPSATDPPTHRTTEDPRRLVPARSERVPCCVFSRHPAHRSSRRRP